MKKHISMMMAAMTVATVPTGCGASGGAAPTDTPTAAPTGAATIAAEAEAETTVAEAEATTEVVQAAGEETEILVAAAANLKNAYEEELTPMFQGKCPDVTVKSTYDSSDKLQTQIEEGLETDVLMSAATEQMATLDEEGMTASDTVTSLLENKIMLIVPTGSDFKLAKLEGIENTESIALGGPTNIPAKQYAEEALTNLGIWGKIQDKASLGTSVTEVLNQVAAASADTDIVYVTDVANVADKVEVVAEAPEGSLTKKIIYPVAAVKNTTHEEQTEDFVEFLKTDEAMKVFETYGFTKGEWADLTNLISSLPGWLP